MEGTPESETLARLFRHKVPRMLLEEGVLAEGVVRNLLAWPHTGFGAHVSRAIPAIVRQILDHLGLPTGAVSLRAPPDPPGGQAADPPRGWSYEPVFDLPVRRTQTGDLPIPDPMPG